MPVDQIQTEEEIDRPDPEATPEAEDNAEEVDSGDDSSITIDGQSFKTEAEALAYARDKITQSDIEIARADAYRQGIAEGRQNVTLPQNVTPQPQEDDKEWEQKFYENPKKAIAEAMEAARKEALKELDGKTTIDRENARLWNRFSELHPDLADFRDDVEQVGTRHREELLLMAKTKGEDAAMNFLATKTRTKFQQWAEKAKPGKPLPNGGGGASPSGGSKDVTKSSGKKSEDKPLSFVDQIKQNKKRHA